MQQLLSRALCGDQKALGAFVRTVWPVIQARAPLELMRRALARKRDLRLELDDLTQEVFRALFEDEARALRAWDPSRGLSLTSYVGLLAESHVASILRSGRRSPFTEEPTRFEDLHELVEPAGGFEVQVASRELLLAIVERLKAELSPRGLELFFALLVEERPVTAVCEQTGMRPDAVYTWRSRLARVARRIAAELQGQSGDGGRGGLDACGHPKGGARPERIGLANHERARDPRCAGSSRQRRAPDRRAPGGRTGRGEAAHRLPDLPGELSDALDEASAASGPLDEQRERQIVRQAAERLAAPRELGQLARVVREERQIAEHLVASSRGEAVYRLPDLPGWLLDGLDEAWAACRPLGGQFARQIVQQATERLAAPRELGQLARVVREERQIAERLVAAGPGEARIRVLLASGNVMQAATETLKALGPEVLGFLVGVVGSEVEAEEILAATCERVWRSFGKFEWRCSLRTWMYVVARHEIDRHRRGAQRHERGRVSASELEAVIAQVTPRSRSALHSERRDAVARLREELTEEDRAILVLRVDRGLSWSEIALSFMDDPDQCTEGECRLEATRVRERFQRIKERLVARAREEGLV